MMLREKKKTPKISPTLFDYGSLVHWQKKRELMIVRKADLDRPCSVQVDQAKGHVADVNTSIIALLRLLLSSISCQNTHIHLVSPDHDVADLKL